MPDFTNYATTRARKILYSGHSGAGKTGSLAALAAMGYNVRIANLDEGEEILASYLLDPKSIYRNARPGLWTQAQADTILERMSYLTIKESHNITGVQAIPKGDSWNRLHQALNAWVDGGNNYGNIGTWTSNDILVIDSFSRYCESALNYQLSLSGRLVEGPRVGRYDDNDYSQTYKLILRDMDLFKSSEIKCHIILICHIQFLDEMTGMPQTEIRRESTKKGFPQTIGPKIAPMIGQYFNHSIRAKQVGSGLSAKRVILTDGDEHIELKTTAPLRVKREYPLATGLAEYFRDLKGEPKPQVQV